MKRLLYILILGSVLSYCNIIAEGKAVSFYEISTEEQASIYQSAIMYEKEGDYQKALNEYKSILNYKDSKKRAETIKKQYRKNTDFYQNILKHMMEIH